MTVEAVPRVDDRGQPFNDATRKLMHATMQTLGRVAIIAGGILVALVNVFVFSGVEGRPQTEVVGLYQGHLSDGVDRSPRVGARSRTGLVDQAPASVPAQTRRIYGGRGQAIGAGARRPGRADASELVDSGGSLAFGLFTLIVGLGGFPYSEEIVFIGSMTIVLFLMTRLVQELEPDKRFTLVGTAVVVFIFRAIPGTGPGTTWWMIDELKFDQQFLSVLSLIGSTLTLAGMFVFRRFMAERSIAYVVGFLTLVGTILSLPVVSMYYGLHEWTARLTGGVVDARFIALIDTALESPLGQISMIPMLVWIANSAPAHLKATFFAVMASFTNLALSLSQLGTKYLNDVYVVTREVRNPTSGAIEIPADYSQLGDLLIAELLLGLALPFAAILFARITRFKSA